MSALTRSLARAVLIALSFIGTAGASTAYSVFGGDSFLTSGASWWEAGYHPENYGYTLLGTAAATETFLGSYNFYILTTYPPDIALIDSVQGSGGGYLDTYIGGNTPDYQNEWGAPDGVYAHIGGQFGGTAGGFIVLDASGLSLTSVTVTAAPLPSAGILFVSGLIGALGLARRRARTEAA